MLHLLYRRQGAQAQFPQFHGEQQLPAIGEQQLNVATLEFTMMSGFSKSGWL